VQRALTEWPIDGLEEVFAIRGGMIQRIYP